MQASSWREQEMLDKRLAELEAQKVKEALHVDKTGGQDMCLRPTLVIQPG